VLATQLQVMRRVEIDHGVHRRPEQQGVTAIGRAHGHQDAAALRRVGRRDRH
jgi:hypothetical protein